MIIGKKGISHLELITAILIFIFAVVIVIYFVNIQKGIETSETILDAFEAELREKAEIDIEKISLFIQGNAECFNISLHSDLVEETFTFIPGTAFNFSEGRLLINNNQQNFYEIYYFSEDVTESIRLENIICTELTEEYYNYSIQYQGKIFSEKKLKNLDLNYKDFQIIVRDLNIDVGKFPPKQTEVRAREIPVEIVKEDGKIIKTTINIKIW